MADAIKNNSLKSTTSLKPPVSEKKEVQLRNISIWLDTYDDIFSDFDPRTYSERTLSDDFLLEVRKVCREKEEEVNEIKLFVPESKRNSNDENVITKRLHAYFKKNHRQYEIQYKGLRRKGWFFACIGLLLMLTASYISALQSNLFFMHSLLVVCEPSGWFLVWAGLDIIFYTSKQNKKEFDFYSKLSKSKVTFSSI